MRQDGFLLSSRPLNASALAHRRSRPHGRFTGYISARLICQGPCPRPRQRQSKMVAQERPKLQPERCSRAVAEARERRETSKRSRLVRKKGQIRRDKPRHKLKSCLIIRRHIAAAILRWPVLFAELIGDLRLIVRRDPLAVIMQQLVDGESLLGRPVVRNLEWDAKVGAHYDCAPGRARSTVRSRLRWRGDDDDCPTATARRFGDKPAQFCGAIGKAPAMTRGCKRLRCFMSRAVERSASDAESSSSRSCRAGDARRAHRCHKGAF